VKSTVNLRVWKPRPRSIWRRPSTVVETSESFRRLRPRFSGDRRGSGEADAAVRRGMKGGWRISAGYSGERRLVIDVRRRCDVWRRRGPARDGRSSSPVSNQRLASSQRGVNVRRTGVDTADERMSRRPVVHRAVADDRCAIQLLLLRIDRQCDHYTRQLTLIPRVWRTSYVAECL